MSSTGSIAVAGKGGQAFGYMGCSSRLEMEGGNFEAKCKLRTGVLHLDVHVNHLLSEIQGNWYVLAQPCMGLVCGPCNGIIKFLASSWNSVHLCSAPSPLGHPGVTKQSPRTDGVL